MIDYHVVARLGDNGRVLAQFVGAAPDLPSYVPRFLHSVNKKVQVTIWWPDGRLDPASEASHSNLIIKSVEERFPEDE